MNAPLRIMIAASLGAMLLGAASEALAAVRIDGQVQAGGGPVASSTVTLWAASAGEPKQLAQAKTSADGSFALSADTTSGPGVSLYLVANGGVAAVNKSAGDNPALAFLAVLGGAPPAKVVVNEMTTIASVWTNAQFLDGTAIKGPAQSLSIAAGNVHNFVDLSTGGYGATIADGLNSTQTPTLANFATLSNVLAGCATRIKADACDRLFEAATAPDGKTPDRHTGGGRVHRAIPVASARKGLRSAGKLLPRACGQARAPAGAFHAVSEFRPKRLGFAAQVRGRRFERRRQTHVRQPGQRLDRR